MQIKLFEEVNKTRKMTPYWRLAVLCYKWFSSAKAVTVIIYSHTRTLFLVSPLIGKQTASAYSHHIRVSPFLVNHAV